MPPAKKVTVSALSLGSTALVPLDSGRAAPAGDVHLVDDSWRPACGDGRVRFVFPGLAPDVIETCARCSTSVAARGRKRTTSHT